MIRGVLIPPDAPAYVVNVTPTLEMFQYLVGGDIESIPLLGGEHAFGYINAEGKMLMLPPNPMATHHASLFLGDYIAGPMLVLGGVDKNGNETEVSDDLIARLVS